MNKISDYIKPCLDILFVGFNPSIRSGETGHHYAGSNNRFWIILHKSGLTPRLYAPQEDFKLIELGYGLTNIVDRPTKGAEDILQEEYEVGRQKLLDKIVMYKPKIVCFVGKGVYQQYAKRRKVEWGFQELPHIEGVREFVAPSSSGLVRMPVNEIIDIYKQLNAIHEE